MKTVVIIPALNEANSIREVIEHIPTQFRSDVIVADNGSTDDTARVAQDSRATVVHALRRGYGSACLAGIAEARNRAADIYVFLDGDYSDYPEDMTKIVGHLIERDLDLVIGSRTRGLAEEGALLPQAAFGNWLSTTLLAWRYGYRFTDLGPFRAITSTALDRVNMRDEDYGWTMEMQIKALRYGLKVGEVPVRYRKRIGESKITGTVKGSVSAGIKILWTLGRYSIPSRDSSNFS